MVSKLFREAERASPGPAGPRGEARLGRQWQGGERAEKLNQEHRFSGKVRTVVPGRGLTAATAELAPRQNCCQDPQEPASGTVPDSCLKTHQPNRQQSAHTGFGTADCGHMQTGPMRTPYPWDGVSIKSCPLSPSFPIRAKPTLPTLPSPSAPAYRQLPQAPRQPSKWAKDLATTGPSYLRSSACNVRPEMMATHTGPRRPLALPPPLLAGQGASWQAL